MRFAFQDRNGTYNKIIHTPVVQKNKLWDLQCIARLNNGTIKKYINKFTIQERTYPWDL